MKVIGITGGIASGKTTVARMLASRGYVHVDSDAVVHRLMREDEETIRTIAERFPKSLREGAIDRAVLAAAIAENEDALAVLESILHPRVVAEETRVIANVRRAGGVGVVLDIPLLYETGAEKRCDHVIVAHAPQVLRKTRAFLRPGMTEEKWQRLNTRQLSDEERCARADAVIATDGSEQETAAALNTLITRWEL